MTENTAARTARFQEIMEGYRALGHDYGTASEWAAEQVAREFGPRR